MSDPVLIWFARDLRLRDHPALSAALDGGGPVIPVFCFDDRLLEGRHRSGPRTQFLLECLADLDRRLRDRGSGLVVRRGHPERELARLAHEIRASALHFSDDVGPFARRRAARVRQAMAALGVEATAHSGTNMIDVGEIATRQGRPYTVFSPFHRTWLEHGRRPVVRAPGELPPLPSRLAKGRIPTLSALGLEQDLEEPAPGGEAEAHRATDRFLDGPVDDYARDNDALGVEGTSRLSPYLHFGCVSPRQLEERLGRGAGPEAFRRQLCWRDFHHHVLLHFPRNARSEFQDRHRGRIEWSYARAAVRCLVRGADRVPARRRGNAPAAPRGLDAQSRAARRRLVPDQGPRHRLALGRALVHAPAARRRRGKQQRQLAVDRLGRNRSRTRRSGGSTTPLATRSATTRTTPTCAATCPSFERYPTSTCASPGRCRASVQRRGRLRDRRATIRSRSSTTRVAREEALARYRGQ